MIHGTVGSVGLGVSHENPSGTSDTAIFGRSMLAPTRVVRRLVRRGPIQSEREFVCPDATLDPPFSRGPDPPK